MMHGTEFTTQEERVLDGLVHAWNAFTQLDRQHPDEADEFRHHIHALQYMMATRVVRRLHPFQFPIHPKESSST
jgi:hypothetical protein